MLFTCSALLFFVLEEVTYFTRHCCVCEHLSNGEDDILSKKLYWLKRYTAQRLLKEFHMLR